MSAPFIPPVDATTQGWWDATAKSEFLLQRCGNCAHVQHPPRPLCTNCGSADPATIAASGHGRIDSFTIVERAPMAGFAPPYVVARVVLAEGPIVLSNIVGCPPAAVRCDQEVELSWIPLDDGRQLPVFGLAAAPE